VVLNIKPRRRQCLGYCDWLKKPTEFLESVSDIIHELALLELMCIHPFHKTVY